PRSPPEYRLGQGQPPAGLCGTDLSRLRGISRPLAARGGGSGRLWRADRTGAGADRLPLRRMGGPAGRQPGHRPGAGHSGRAMETWATLTLTPSSHPGRHQDVLSGAVHQAEEEGARRHVADQHVETRRTGVRRRRRLLRRACGDRGRRGVEHPLAVFEAFPPGGIHLAAQTPLLVRKGLAGTEQEQETEQTGAGAEGRRHGVVRLGERGESSDRRKRRPWRSTLTVRRPTASTRAPATRSPTRRVWPLITARAPS